MNTMIPLDFDGRAVRVVHDDAGVPWFNAGDVCAILGYVNPRTAVGAHVDPDDVAKRDAIDALCRTQAANHVNESGLYALIFGSAKDEAKRFKRWVTSEVLPALRQAGHYEMPETPPPEEAAPAIGVGPTHYADQVTGAARTFAALLRTGRMMRLSHARSLEAANNATLRATGVDLVAEMGVDDLLPADAGGPQPGDPEHEPPPWDGNDAVLAYVDGRNIVTVDEIARAVFPGADDRTCRWRISRLLGAVGWRGRRGRVGNGWSTTFRRRA